MSKLSLSIQIGGVLLIAATIGSFAAEDEPSQSISIDQNLDQATLRRYHHTHQGTVIPPAAWLAAIENADDDGKYMANENLQQLGFIVDNDPANAMNPHGINLMGFPIIMKDFCMA